MTEKEKAKSVEKISNKCFRKCIVITSILTSLLAVMSYKIYLTWTAVPDLPEFDLNAQWSVEEMEQDTSIRKFRIVFTESMQDDLRVRFERYRELKKTKHLNGTGITYGLGSDAFSQIFTHWLFKYKYHERERFLNQFEHFKTNIQGLDIHFVHVKPTVRKNVKVLPLLLLHGWPGSSREFYDVIPLLTRERPGFDFVFEVIVPDLPGFGFSQATTKQGLNSFEISIIMRNLMQRLGFNKFYIQGGDFGHNIGSHLATIFPHEVLGFHTNLLINFSRRADLVWILGAVWPRLVGNDYAERMYPLSEQISFLLEEFGYMHLQGTKPDTIGIALKDSPVGLATYILDRFMVFTDPKTKALEDGGLSSHYSYDALLDNIMIYWASGCITSSMRLYKESFNSSSVEQTLALIPSPVPTWGLRLKHEIKYQPDFLVKWKYNLVGSTTLDEGGHFAAMEKPQELADDVFKAVAKFIEVTK